MNTNNAIMAVNRNRKVYLVESIYVRIRQELLHGHPSAVANLRSVQRDFDLTFIHWLAPAE